MAYYTRTYNPQPTTRVASTDLKNEFQAVENGLASAETADGKAIRAPEATTALPSAASRALKVLSFDASGNPVTTFAKADIDAQASAAAASAIAADSSAYDAAASSSASGASAVAAALSESAAAASAAAADASADAAAASAASIADGPVVSVNGMTGVVTLPTSAVSLSGSTDIYVGQVITYTVTDYNAFSAYAVSVTAGSASIAGDQITFTAPATAQSVTLTVTRAADPTAFALTVQAAGVATPSITSPINAATGALGPSLTLTSSTFGWLGVADTHLDSDWQLATDAGFATIVQSTTADAANKTSWTATVATGTTYYARVRHRGVANGVSAYSATVSFATAATFNAYIATPTATPAAFGNALEGGFYTGMIWNELVQSTTSTTIGTGSKVFTVADMTASPLVYAGQTLEVRSRANPANKMIGTVTGASGTSLTINVTTVGGSGAFADWSIMAQYRVIVAPKSTGENTSIAYKNANTAAPAACSTLTEGRKATLAMVAADTATVYPAAHWCNNLSIAGKTDWYLPARDELELCWRNLKPTADANHTTADRGDSAIDYKNLGAFDDTVITHGTNNNSSPSGAAYTTGVPAQVAAGKNFRTGESEAFVYSSFHYLSASEYSDSLAWTQAWHSTYPGYQRANSKAFAYYVRAVRRSII